MSAESGGITVKADRRSSTVSVRVRVRVRVKDSFCEKMLTN